jgi:DNA-binding protein H-NS
MGAATKKSKRVLVARSPRAVGQVRQCFRERSGVYIHRNFKIFADKILDFPAIRIVSGINTNQQWITMNLKAMSIDRLSKLREQVDSALNAKVIEERRAVQDELSKLDRLAAGGRGKGVRGGLRGAVAPKYRNPDNPEETWAGRGLKPRWLAAALKTGKKLEDFSITAPVKRGRAASKKARRK